MPNVTIPIVSSALRSSAVATYVRSQSDAAVVNNSAMSSDDQDEDRKGCDFHFVVEWR